MPTRPTQPTNWQETTLGEVLTIRRGASPRPIHDYISEDGMPWVKIADATASDSRYLTETKQYIKEEGISKSIVVEPGDLILSNSATPGLPKFMSIKACIHDGWLWFDDYKGIDKKFLYYFFLDARRKMIHSASGSVFKNLKTDIVKNFPINLPPLPTQRAIAAVLSSLDDKIENLRAQNETLEAMAAALFREWFVEFRFPGYEDVDMVESEIGEIPEGWSVGTIDNFIDLSIGRTPPRKEKEWFSATNGVKWVSIKDLGNCGTYIFNTSEYLTEDAVEKHRVPIIPKNTVILSFKLTVGRVAITTEKMVSNEAIAHLKIRDTGTLSVIYVYLFLRNFDFDSLGSTSSIARAVNSQTIRDIKMVLPEESMMNLFDEKVISIFEKIKNNSNQIQTLVQLRDTLLPKLMSGEVEVE